MGQIQDTQSIAFKGINSANIRLDNSAVADRVYDISSNTDISSQTVNGFSGEVRRASAILATFNCYGGDDNLSIGFTGAPIAKQIEIMGAIQEFMEKAREYVASSGLTGGGAATEA